MSLILLLSSLLKVRLAPRGARLASNAGESPHSSAISIVQEPLPSTRREGRRIGDETHILHASNSASSPREKKSEDFRKARFFPPRPRPFGQGPVKRKATYSTQPKTKSKPLGEKKMRKPAHWPRIARQTRRQGLPVLPSQRANRFGTTRAGCRPWPATARFGRLRRASCAWPRDCSYRRFDRHVALQQLEPSGPRNQKRLRRLKEGKRRRRARQMRDGRARHPFATPVRLPALGDFTATGNGDPEDAQSRAATAPSLRADEKRPSQEGLYRQAER